MFTIAFFFPILWFKCGDTMLGLGNSEQQTEGALKSTCEKYRICVLLLALFARLLLLATARPQILDLEGPLL